MIKTSLNKLIQEIELTQKIKDILIVIMKILNYDEEDILKTFEFNNKKKKFFNIFK